ncbi:MAG: GTPase domain-containing protein [Acidimicrobiia bacterium]|nr:GTPase domain-containing protein [Acidimicrobiia bacterium]
MRGELESLATVLERVAFRLPGSEDLDQDRALLVRSIRDYLIPRLRDPDAPVVVAIVGPTGTGKSTMLNALARDHVTDTGAVRPTTRSPVLFAHRSNSGPAWSDFVARIREHVGPNLETVVSDDPITSALTLVDTPPLGHVAESGSSPAEEIIRVADLCLFVTSPLRYADAAAWDVLRDLRKHGVPLLFVLNRVTGPDDERAAVAADYVHRLFDAGILTEPDPELLFVVSESEGADVAMADAVVALRAELLELVDPEFRLRLIDETTEQSVRSLTSQAQSLAADLDSEVETVLELDRIVSSAYGLEADHLRSELEAGSLAWLVDHDHWPSAAVDLTGMVTRRAGDAAQSGAEAWSRDDIGSVLLAAGGQGLWRHGHDTTYETQRKLDEWYESLGTIAGRRTRRGELGTRKRKRFSDQLWRATFDPEFELSGRVRRKLGDPSAAVVETRAALVTAVRAALDFDAARFAEALGGTLSAPLGVQVDRHVAEILQAIDQSPEPSAAESDAAEPEAAEAEELEVHQPEDAEAPDAVVIPDDADVTPDGVVDEEDGEGNG